METSGPDVSDGALATVSRRQASSYSTDISRTEYGVWEEGRSLHPICKDRSFQDHTSHSGLPLPRTNLLPYSPTSTQASLPFPHELAHSPPSCLI